jgi:hypothetical protein
MENALLSEADYLNVTVTVEHREHFAVLQNAGALVSKPGGCKNVELLVDLNNALTSYSSELEFTFRRYVIRNLIYLAIINQTLYRENLPPAEGKAFSSFRARTSTRLELCCPPASSIPGRRISI